jgi:ABC-type dipeptide/oligopeptide/nickel transport system permease subunit
MKPAQVGQMNLAQSRNVPMQSSTILGASQTSSMLTDIMPMMIEMMVLMMVMKMMTGMMSGMTASFR